MHKNKEDDLKNRVRTRGGAYTRAVLGGRDYAFRVEPKSIASLIP